MNENELEIQYFYCLENKCPLESSKSRSLAKMVSKGIGFIPERFSDLQGYVTMFFSYVKQRKEDIYRDDCETYLAWRIWHYKLSDINRYIVNPVCKCKAHLVAKNALVEFHKSATRIKKAGTTLDNLLTNCKDEHEIFQGIKEIKELLSIQADKALAVYDSVLKSHQLAMSEVNILIEQKINQTPLLGEQNNA